MLISRFLILLSLASAVALTAQAASVVPVQQKPLIMVPANPMRPLAVSPNGEWVMYGDGTPKLHRVSTRNKQESHTLTLPASPLSISLSRSARQALVTTVCQGVGLIDFSRTTPEIAWIKEPHNGCTAIPGSYSFEYRPAAISPDGETFASHVYSDRITTYSAKDRTPLFDFPFVGRDSLLHLEFLPGNRFLLAIESSSRDEKSSASAWGTVYSLWDLESKQLHSSVEMPSAHEPTPNALLGMSHFSGEGWAIRQTEGMDVPEFVRFPLRGCATTSGAPQALALGGVGSISPDLRWAADSFGRWLAVGRLLKGASGELGGRHVVEIFDVSSTARTPPKSPLTRLFATGEISQMRASLDGTTMWATLVDGRLERFDVPMEALQLNTARTEPAKGFCLPSDEAPEARLIDSSKPTHVARMVYEIPLSNTPAATSCPPAFRPEMVGAAGGVLVNDTGPELVVFDPGTGGELQRIPTPGSTGICSVTMPQIRSFLTYQGDTVALRPWVGDRRVFASRPGWKVAWVGAGFRGKYRSIVFVTWVPKNPDVGDQTAAGISAAYSLKTGELIREAAATYCEGRGAYPVVSCDRTMVELSEEDLQKHGAVTIQEYAASVGAYRSLVVHHREKPGEAGTVIFRQGVHGTPHVDLRDAKVPESTIRGVKRKKDKTARRFVAPYYLKGFVLNDHLVLGVKGTSADLYDYRSRTLVATLDEESLNVDAEALWHAESRTLWVVGQDRVLQGWRIEPSHP